MVVQGKVNQEVPITKKKDPTAQTLFNSLGTVQSWTRAVLGQWSWDTSLGTVVLGQWSWDSGLGTEVLGQ